MRFGSICSGIEAASSAFTSLGWQAAWFSEIEPFPCAVLAQRHPEVHNFGDMTMLPESILNGFVEAPDLLCGGTPCQAFSVAGLRNSLDDARGNLSLTFCEIADAIDHVRASRGDDPAVILWENVPGVLSTKDNAFGCFLAGLAGEEDALVPAGKKWTNAGVVLGPKRAVAWRILDAQYFGVAQRRRRLFVVASARDGFDPCAVLFESEGVRRDSPPSRGPWEEAAATLEASAGRSRGAGTPVGLIHPETIGTLDARTTGGGFPGTDGARNGHVIAQPYAVANCLTQRMHKGINTTLDEGQTPVLAFDTTQITSATNRSNPQYGDPCHPLAAGAHVPAIAFDCKGSVPHFSEEITGTLRGMTEGDSHANGGGQIAVAFSSNDNGHNGGGDVIPALKAGSHGGNAPGVALGMCVRRLTPRECERLQGFSDDHTLVTFRKKPAADGPRYKALGNSWAVPCVRWIGARIDDQVVMA